jgi:hypothetical protein
MHPTSSPLQNSSLSVRLRAFVRKYYRNQMLRGVLLLLGVWPVGFLVVAGLEAVGHFGTGVRTGLFYGFALFSMGVVYAWVLTPALRLLRIGSVLSEDEAARIVGRHFSDIEDRLVNTLQLERRALAKGSPTGEADSIESSGAGDLLLASIAQRTEALKPYRFTAAVEFGENRRFLRYAVPAILVLSVTWWLQPEAMQGSADRLIRHRTEMVDEAVFRLELLESDIEVLERGDATVQVRAVGRVNPSRVTIAAKGAEFRMARGEDGVFRYVFRHVQEGANFTVSAAGAHPVKGQLRLRKRPELQALTVEVVPPKYTGLARETVSNDGGLSVPAGTRLSWQVKTRAAGSLRVHWGGDVERLSPEADQVFAFERRAMSDLTYVLTPVDDQQRAVDSVAYGLHVIPDRHPAIRVQETSDSASFTRLYFNGLVRDDYGFSRLEFHWKLRGVSGNTGVEALARPSGREDGFFYAWNLQEVGVQMGDQLSYWFEIWDNDEVRGSKVTRSQTFTYAAPDAEALAEQNDSTDNAMTAALEDGLEEARRLRQEMERLRRKMQEKDELGWEEKAELEELIKDQQALKEQVESMQEKNRQNDKKQSEFKQPSESIQKKQEALQRLLDEVMTDELRAIYDEMRELMEQMEDADKEKIEEQLSEMDLDQENLENELDRAIEQFKQLQWEQKMEETIEALEELAEKQEELSEQEPDKAAQDSLNSEFDKLKEALDDLEKLNEQLEDPNETPETEALEEEIEQKMEESSEQIESGKKKKASQSQKSASEKMKEMAKGMESSMESESEAKEQEDMDALRALLENIVQLSFDQEEVMRTLAVTHKDDPRYVEHGQDQRKLKDDAEMVKDSLFALSMRVPQLQAIVNQEINLVNHHMGIALDGFTDRETAIITSNQQYVMTSFNNLALLLDEVLKQMQNASSCDKPGTGNCEKPGGSGSKPSPSPGDLKKMQEGLSKQLEKMKQQMAGFNQGTTPQGKRKLSKELAQMAAHQAAIRKMTEELGKQMNEDGSGQGNGLGDLAKEMEELEKDIVNGQLSELSLIRQQDILSRLLEAENADRIRGEKEERKSKTAREGTVSSPPGWDAYRRQKELEIELLRTVPASLTPYYKQQVNDYFNTLERAKE